MNVAETINKKVIHLPSKAQEEVLDAVARIEERYQSLAPGARANGTRSAKHPLTMIAELAVDVGVSDFAERHDFYAHGKIED